MRDKRVYSSLITVAVLAVLVGSALPWARLGGPFGEFTKRGLEDAGDGIITLVLGLIAVWAVAYYFFVPGTGLVRGSILAVLGAGIISVAALNLADIESRAAGALQDLESLAAAEEIPVSLVAGEGIYLTLIGGIAIFLAGLAAAALPLLPATAPDVPETGEPVAAAATGEAPAGDA
ncbi:MAG: hypothetical protein HYS09_01830 [Chloroflexi bacterium]|nr:hypothetical protein [Chloroflexota bacterium]